MPVRSAIHICTGAHAAAEKLDAWLREHDVEVTPLADVYDACVFVLQEYAHVPDLVLVGVDWLAEHEFAIVRYVRETWPRAGVVLYGSASDTPLAEGSPFIVSCRSDAALRKLMRGTPTDVTQRIYAAAGSTALPRDGPETPSVPDDESPHAQIDPVATGEIVKLRDAREAQRRSASRAASASGGGAEA